MFIVTFHGGSGGTWTLYSYNDQGGDAAKYLAQATPSGTTGFRDVQFQPPAASGRFYLVNSYQAASEVLPILPTATTVPSPFVSGSGVCSVYHPFGLAFDSGLEVLYVSNQDSNVVIRVYGPNNTSSGASPGQPMPVNPALLSQFKSSSFLPGTFVASQVPFAPPGCATPTPTTVHSQQGGLAALPPGLLPTQTPGNSVRGVAVIGSTLYVADEVANLIRLYDTTKGTYLGAIADPNKLVQSPVHLLVNAGLLYITVAPKAANALVLRYDPAKSTLSAVVDASPNVSIHHPSGMTFDGSGNFYLCDLDGNAVYQFDSHFNPSSHQFISGMPDNPEFILWVNDTWLQSSSPHK